MTNRRDHSAEVIGREPDAPFQGVPSSDAVLGEVERLAHLGCYVWRPGGDPPQWSDEFFRIIGYEPGEVTPGFDAFSAVVHPADLERVRVAWAQMQEGQTDEMEYRIVHRGTRQTRYVRAAGRVYREGGEIAQIVGALQDITEARSAAVALEEALAIARAAERVAGLGSFVMRIEPRELVCSEGFKALISPGDALSEASVFERVHPDDRERQQRWWDQLVCERSGEPLSVRVVRPDGSVRHLFTQAAVMRLADGVERIVGTTIDVTHRVELEEQLRHVAKMEAVGALAAGVAHDFNNYLMVMDSSLSMLADSSEVAEREELVESGRMALSRCMELTRQLLAFARRQPFRPECVDLTLVVVKFQELLNRAVGRRASLRLVTQGSDLRARVDPHHVERMLTNLVVNAADAIEELATRTGRITVRLEAVTLVATQRAVPGDIPPGAYVCVAVEDNGGGIEPARLPRIFEPYFTTKPQGRGTGLGLASVYGMIRQNDGQVSVEDLASGTRFTLWFPRIRALTEAPSGHGIRAEARADANSGPQILIVEDVDQVRDIAARILRSAGFRILTASHGAEALALLDQGHDVRLILSDLQMPVMGGRQLAERVRVRSESPPVIFMTGYSEETHGQGCDACLMLLAKPFTPDRLIAFVKSALG